MFCKPTILIKKIETWGLGTVTGCLFLSKKKKKKKKSPKIADKIKSRMACGCR